MKKNVFLKMVDSIARANQWDLCVALETKKSRVVMKTLGSENNNGFVSKVCESAVEIEQEYQKLD